ncbi:hypothetical protein Hanom_Chr05g00393181 [Helianthus anomalus]
MSCFKGRSDVASARVVANEAGYRFHTATALDLLSGLHDELIKGLFYKASKSPCVLFVSMIDSTQREAQIVKRSPPGCNIRQTSPESKLRLFSSSVSLLLLTQNQTVEAPDSLTLPLLFPFQM